MIKPHAIRSMYVILNSLPFPFSIPSDKIVNEPREIISAIENVVLEEPENKEALSLCCGGPVEFVFLKLSEEVAKIRYKELTATGADTIVTACPIYAINFRRVADGNTRVIDLVDLIYESIVGG
ncbi:MAG: heterodisulfide reductase-related iron-sulfur binding cluster [Candidatus Asgardarchaeia archaeon]